MKLRSVALTGYMTPALSKASTFFQGLRHGRLDKVLQKSIRNIGIYRYVEASRHIRV